MWRKVEALSNCGGVWVTGSGICEDEVGCSVVVGTQAADWTGDAVVGTQTLPWGGGAAGVVPGERGLGGDSLVLKAGGVKRRREMVWGCGGSQAHGAGGTGDSGFVVGTGSEEEEGEEKAGDEDSARSAAGA
jgi:hypothetical protein